MNKRVFNALRKVAAAAQIAAPSATSSQRCPTCGAVKQQSAEPRPTAPNGRIPDLDGLYDRWLINQERRRIDPDYDWERSKLEREAREHVENNIPPSKRQGIYRWRNPNEF